MRIHAVELETQLALACQRFPINGIKGEDRRATLFGNFLGSVPFLHKRKLNELASIFHFPRNVQSRLFTLAMNGLENVVELSGIPRRGSAQAKQQLVNVVFRATPSASDFVFRLNVDFLGPTQRLQICEIELVVAWCAILTHTRARSNSVETQSWIAFQDCVFKTIGQQR